ncbi:MAG: response regulator transcription factor [Chloroflexi bacterium]|nr:MAG: response regulator transcription factor [Chloroflexota bacterium]
MAPILVVDDDAKIVNLVRTYLEREGFRVVTAADGTKALQAIREHGPRLVVLDLMLPELDGLAVLRCVREESDLPVLMLSARGSAADRVYGIHEGADDYLPKPFSPAELAQPPALGRARVESGRLTHLDLTVDLDRYEVLRGKERIALTAAEFRLLVALLRADGRVLSREMLLDVLYGRGEGEALDRTIDAHIARLRDKLGDDAERPRYVATVRRAGYRTLTGKDA